MPAKHFVNENSKLIVTTWEGDAHDVEFIEAIKKYQNEIQNHPDYVGYNEVVDLTRIGKINLTTEGIKTIGSIASNTDQDNANRRLALIVSSNFAYGLSRMYVTYRELATDARKKIRVFKNEKDAYEWVKANPS